MADNSVADPGAGGDTFRTKDRAGIKTEIVGLDLTPAGGSETLMNGVMPVSDNSGSLTVDNAGTFAVQADTEMNTFDHDTGVGTDNQPAVGILRKESGGAVLVGSSNPLPVSLAASSTDGAAGSGSGNVIVAGIDGSNVQSISTDSSGRVAVQDGGTSLTVDNGGTFAVQADTELPAAAALADGAANPTAPAVGGFGMLWNGTTWDRCPGGATNGITANLKALNGTTVATNSGNKDAGTQRVVLATDQVQLTNALKVDGSAVTQPVSLAANQSVNNAQVAGTATSVNSGTKDAGTQRVILASDQTVVPISDNAGSLTVDSPVGTPAFVRLSDGAAAITTLPVSLASLPALAAGSALAGRVNLDPQTANGLSIFHLVSAATTNATNIKASAGQVYGWYIYNSNAAARKVVFHNTAGTPTAGASVIFALMIPPTSAANVEMTNGLAFATGIAITTVTDLTDAGATAVAASDLIINIFYK